MGAVIGALGRGEPGLDGGTRARSLGGEALPLRVVGLHVDVDQGAVAQALGEPFDDGALQGVGVEGLSHPATAALLHRGALDAQPPMVAVLHAHAAPTGTAAQQAGQQVLRPTVILRPFPAGERLHAGGALEQVVVDDAQVLGLGAVPLGLGVRAADAPAGVRILQHADAVPHERPAVERVRQDAVATLPVAVDGDGGPAFTPRRRHAFSVELARDGARRLSGRVVGEDAPDHRSLLLDDLELARPARHDAVAVGPAAGMAPVPDDARHAAARLVGEVLEVEGADQPADADLDLVGHAVVNGADLDPDEAQPLVDPGEVLLVAAHAVERFHDQHIEGAPLGGVEHPHDAIAADDARP